MVTVSCEHYPIFVARVNEEGQLTLSFSDMQAILECHDSLSNVSCYQPEADCFIFEEAEGKWVEYFAESAGFYFAPDWMQPVDACPDCLCYSPCDCDPKTPEIEK